MIHFIDLGDEDLALLENHRIVERNTEHFNYLDLVADLSDQIFQKFKDRGVASTKTITLLSYSKNRSVDETEINPLKTLDYQKKLLQHICLLLEISRETAAALKILPSDLAVRLRGEVIQRFPYENITRARQLIDTLEFYADPMNHHAMSADRASAVFQDHGQQARRILYFLETGRIK